MACFHDLSIDILYIIVAHLQDDGRLLRDLSLSCRVLCDIAQRFLVRIVLISKDSHPFRPQSFLRTLTARPDLIPHVHRLIIQEQHELTHWTEDEETISAIIRCLTNLTELWYVSLHRTPHYYRYVAPFPSIPDFVREKVTRIDWRPHSSIDTLYHCMTFPRIDAIYWRLFETKLEYSNLVAKTSSVTALRLGIPPTPYVESLQLALAMPRCLRALALEAYGSSNSGPKSNAVMSILEPVREDLQQLEIYFRESPFQSGRSVSSDFSTFISLRKLGIPLRFLFGSGGGDDVCIAGRLPPQLEKLVLLFEPRIDDDRYYKAHRDPDWYFNQFKEWATDERVHKEQPLLRHVSLEESQYIDSDTLPLDLVRDLVSSWSVHGSPFTLSLSINMLYETRTTTWNDQLPVILDWRT